MLFLEQNGYQESGGRITMVKIYGTLGPACQDEKILTEMFALGMTGMRLNLSHVTLAESGELIGKMKWAAESCGVKPQLLIDLQGPELRTGAVAEPILLKNEEIVEICAAADWKTENERNDRCGDMDLIRSATDQKDQKVVEFLEKNSREELTETADKKKNSESSPVQNRTSAQRVSARIELPDITIPYLIPGQEILLDDGKIHLKVVENSENIKPGSGEKRRYFAKVLWGGLLKSRKSAAFPGAKINSPTLTKADLENIRLAKEMGVTGVMQPFVRGREDLECVKNALQEAGAEDVKLFAKIENLDGVRKLEELLPGADEIVIARGDLGNAVHLWDLPSVQREISQKCQATGKPFMVVTQMLASMERNPVPTRAEVNGIFHAVLDGASSVMVTGETAAGDYPVEVIRYLVNTVRSAELVRHG